MVTTILKPFMSIWRAMVNYHREHLADDPDVEQLRKQERQAVQANKRLNIVERRYLKGDRP